MNKTTFHIPEKAGITLSSTIHRHASRLRRTPVLRAAGFLEAGAEPVQPDDKVTVQLEASAADQVLRSFQQLAQDESIERLAGNILSALVRVSTAQKLVSHPQVKRIQSKKRSVPHMEKVLPDVGIIPTAGAIPRQPVEDGKDVLIGVIDSGFDLSHPMFWDGNTLRVEQLLDQVGNNQQYDAQTLQKAGWAVNTVPAGLPGADKNGHGTHVASIAGGSPWQNREGVAPKARFLLVRTDFLNTDKAVTWVFDEAKKLNKPCVVNLSLGHHWGAHDGTDVEEQLHCALAGPGKIIVVSAGNERTDNIHLGGNFVPEQSETVTFDVLRQPDGKELSAAISLWWNQDDDFDVKLITPTGQVLDVPALNTAETYDASSVSLELGRKMYAPSKLICAQVSVAFTTPDVPNQSLWGWKLKLTCLKAAVGRLDGWVNNSGNAMFRPHSLVEMSRTIGLPATGPCCLAVASYVSKNAWQSSLGSEIDAQVLAGRTSPFSSQGPTRDGRWKPELSAPGEYVTAALAAGSKLAELDQRSLTAQRLLTIEGTSMAAPVVTGAVALLLQKKPTLTVTQVLEALKKSAQRDDHTGPSDWTIAYGYGKLNVVKALNQV